MKDLIKAYKELEAEINRLRKELGWLWVFLGILILIMLWGVVSGVWKALAR